MRLCTLGGLSLEGSALSRSKPLLLVAYLALEGPQERRYLAELFWMGSSRPRSSLSVALSQVRKAVPDGVSADQVRVWTDLDSDVRQFLTSLESGRPGAALDHYRGRFADGVTIGNGNVELEEWLYATRELLARRARQAMLEVAEDHARKGNLEAAVGFGERARRVSGAPELEPDEIGRLFTLFVAAGSPYGNEIAREAEAFGLSLELTREQAAAVLVPAGGDQRGPSQLRIPTPGTALVGRDPERVELAQMLAGDDCRLVTLTGPGGVGKTRLSLQVAQDLERADGFRDGVHPVLLDALTSPRQIALSIADALDLELHGPADAAQQVASQLADTHCLLVLDNFEHLIEGAPLLSRLLRDCPRLKLLVSSRERLNLTDEWSYPVEGLAFPDQEPAEPEELRFYDAVQLFVQRARRVDLRFEAGPEELRSILRICQLVDGFPLGLELAATWVRLLTPGEIASEIEANLDFLSSASRDAPERHQSLRAVFEHSWRQLTAREQDALRKLAVFRGGFRREAAAEVCGATLPTLAGLVDKSLLRASRGGRYDRHALLYQYMHEKLAQDPVEHERTRASHGRYFFQFLQNNYQQMLSGNQGKALDAIEQDLENIRSAWFWALADGNTEAILDMSDPIRAFHDTRARYQEGHDLFSEAARRFEATGSRTALGYLLVMQAWFGSWLGRYDLARKLAERGVELLRPDGRDDHLAQGLNILGTIAWRLGQYPYAKRCFLETLGLVSGRKRVNALNNLAMAEDSLGDYRAAVEHYQEALAWNRETNNTSQIVINIINLASALSNFGEFERAQQLLQEGVSIAREHDLQQTLPYLLAGLGNVLTSLNQYPQAQAFCEEALALHRKLDDPVNTLFTLSVLGRIATEQASFSKARDYFSEALELARNNQVTDMTFKPIGDAASLLAKREDFATAASYFNLILHHPVSDRVSKDVAGERLQALRAHLSPQAFAVASRQGEAMSSQPLPDAITALNRRLTLILGR